MAQVKLGGWVPIPFSVFPSAYRNAELKDSASVQVVENEAHFEHQALHGREGHEEVHESFSATVQQPPPPTPQQEQHHDVHIKEEVHIHEEERLGGSQHGSQYQKTPQLPQQLSPRPSPKPSQHREEVRVHEHTSYRHPQQATPQQHREEIHIHEETRYRQPQQASPQQQLEVQDRTYDRHFDTVHGPATDYAPTQIDVTEHQFRERTRPIVAGAGYPKETFITKHNTYPNNRAVDSVDKNYPAEVRVEQSARSTAQAPKKFKRDMGYYDNEGQYHSLRQGISKAAHKVADRVQHPIHPHRHQHSHHKSFAGAQYDDQREEIVVKEKYTTATPSVAPSRPVQSAPTSASIAPSAAPARPVRKMASKTITIPCHHIRIGDLLILQGRPCQVIRITTSSQTGQHRYLGVDLFTKQLHEESSFISNPAPSVVVQNMLGPVFKQYRVLDIREDGRVVAMTESGDVKQGLPVLDQSGLHTRLSESFDNGRGSVRILVIEDDGMEMAVDYKVVHGSRL
ncbi:eIF-5a domain containing protein [Pyrenophora tritici-repentis]|nr:eIF-5a domain containing protein [Pyrenophora tritici-repentis]